MKRIYFISILAAICSMTAMAQNSPGLAHQTNGKDRIEFGLFADMPDLIYDSETNQIIVDGQNSSYYDVIITSLATEQVVFMTVIDGNYDIIDASIMPSGAYVIYLTSSHGNAYSWTFDQGLQTGMPGGIAKRGEWFNRHSDFVEPTLQF